MPVNTDSYHNIIEELSKNNVTLVTVSKTKPIEDIEVLYQLGQRDFGENYVQELVDKQNLLPSNIHWHFIGHLQSNKVKYIAPFVYIIQGVDSYKLLKEINKQGEKFGRIINCLLQVHIAQEETKFGMDENDLAEVTTAIPELKHVSIRGLMGMASFSEDVKKVREEFTYLKRLFKKFSPKTIQEGQWTTLSMGMSGDYKIALEEGSTMVRIGSLLFGARI